MTWPPSADPTPPQGHRKALERIWQLGVAAQPGKAGRHLELGGAQRDHGLGRARRDQGLAQDFLRLLEAEEAPRARDPRAQAEPSLPEDPLLDEPTPGPTSEEALLQAQLSTRHAELKGREDLEKRWGSWRGPSPLAGLPAAAALGLSAASPLQGGESARSRTPTRSRGERPAGEAQVERELIRSLQEAGLVAPLTGLGDPRLDGASSRLTPEEGWLSHPSGTGASMSWTSTDRASWQRVTWGEGLLRLESASGGRVQVLERAGGLTHARLETRPGPEAFPDLPD